MTSTNSAVTTVGSAQVGQLTCSFSKKVAPGLCFLQALLSPRSAAGAPPPLPKLLTPEPEASWSLVWSMAATVCALPSTPAGTAGLQPGAQQGCSRGKAGHGKGAAGRQGGELERPVSNCPQAKQQHVDGLLG